MGVFLVHIISGLVIAAASDNGYITLADPDLNVNTAHSLKQQWDLKPYSDGSYYICNSYFESCIFSSTANLHLAQLNFADNTQKWQLAVDSTVRPFSNTTLHMYVLGNIAPGDYISLSTTTSNFNYFAIADQPKLYDFEEM